MMQDLIKAGVMLFAKEPKDNPSSLDFEFYTISLIAHDYPAGTPHMWNAVYKKLDLPYGSIMFVADPENISEIFTSFREDPKYLGGGMGVGFKDEAPRYLDSVEKFAEQIGAVNVIVKMPPDGLRGYNTDALGFVTALEERLAGESVEDNKCVVLGAGGTASAIAFTLAGMGAKVWIVNRTVEKAKELSERINLHFGYNASAFSGRNQEEIMEVLRGARVVVAAIDDSQIPMESYSALGDIVLPASTDNILRNTVSASEAMRMLPSGVVVADVLLRKEETATLKLAREAGFRTMDGKAMLINQGVEAFFIVHGDVLKDKKISRQVLREIMSN